MLRRAPGRGEGTVPVERVRLGTETVTEQTEVSEQVRQEQIDEPGVNTDRLRGNR